MNKSILLFVLALPLFSLAQVIDTVTYINCEVVTVGGHVDIMENVFDVDIYIDFGGGKVFGPRKPIKDASGKAIVFPTLVDALNYLARDRWQIQTSTLVYYGLKLVSHHYLKRPKYQG